MRKFFKYALYALAISLVCGVFACKDKDDEEVVKEEPVTPLPSPYLELPTATDADLIFGGDVETKTVALTVNRNVVATSSDDWVTLSVARGTDGKTAVLTVTSKKHDGVKRRATTITLTAQLGTAAEGETATSAPNPLTIAVTQTPYGLPEADLLDLVFTITGGPGSARDISKTANRIIEGGVDGRDETNLCAFTKLYPTVSFNETYGRNTAHFPGGREGEGCNNSKSSAYYKIDLVDFGVDNLRSYHYYNDDRTASTPEQKAANRQIPFTALGEGIMKNSYSVEVILKPELPAAGYGRGGKALGWTQSCGGSVDAYYKQNATLTNCFGFYMDFNTDGDPYSNTSDGGACETNSETNSISDTYDKYYHVIGTYSIEGALTSLYVDGELIQSKSTAGKALKIADPKGNDPNALGQWVCVGGDCRRNDPILADGTIIPANTTLENWNEFTYTGEIVVARFYSKALSDTEVKLLYDYEKP